MSALHLSQEGVDLIHCEGALSYPDECCGFLFGRSNDEDHDVTNVQSIRNEQDENRARRFLISPEQFRKAEKYAEERGMKLLGFYHTHPDHPAIPSEFDREHALPFYSYVILSVRRREPAELRSWQLDLDREGYREETISIKAEITE